MRRTKSRLQKLHRILHNHIHKVWPGQKLDFFSWELGPIVNSMPEFRVARVEPSQTEKKWIYFSTGLSEVVKFDGYGLELFLLSPWEEALHVELFAMLANYCCDSTTSKLGLNSIFDIGRPWLENSSCDHLLISLPYTIGPRVEWPVCEIGYKIRVLWILPITANEASFAKLHGVEALEKEFDKHRINPVDPYRSSVIK